MREGRWLGGHVASLGKKECGGNADYRNGLLVLVVKVLAFGRSAKVTIKVSEAGVAVQAGFPWSTVIRHDGE